MLPGQKETIKVKYDTKRIGVINKTIKVYSNAKQPLVILRIKGKVVAKQNSVIPEKKVERGASPINK